MRDRTPISEATTNLCPSISSPCTHTSIDKEAKSEQAGITTSVNTIGLPKSRITNLLAPLISNIHVYQKVKIKVRKLYTYHLGTTVMAYI